MEAIRKTSGKQFTVVAGANIAAGAVVIAGGLHGVAPYPIASGCAGVVDREGEFEMTCDGGATSQGAAAYFDTTSRYVTATSGGELIGKFAAAVTSGATVCRVILD
jgi:predicted RecA/RadA family phage recombinase